MEVQFDDSNAEQGALTISLTAAEVSAELNLVAGRLATAILVPGFPKGKAPVDIVLEKYNVQCKAEATAALLNKHVTEALVTAKRRAGVHPTLSDADRPSPGKRWVGQFDKAGALSFTVTYPRPPQVDQINLDGMTIEVDTGMCARWVDNQLKLFKESVATLATVERAAIATDIVTVNAKTIDPYEKPLAGGQFDGLRVNLTGKKSPVSELMAQYLLGKSAGDKFSFNQSIPITHADPYLRGKDIRFDVEVIMVSELNMPELSDETIKSSGHESVESLRTALTDEWHRLFKKANRSRTALQIRTQMVANNPFSIPQKWIDDECEFVASQLQLDWSKVKDDPEQAAKILEIADRTVKSDFLLDALADRNPELLLTTIDVIDYADEEVNSGVDGEAYVTQLKRAGQYEAFIVQAQKTKTLDWVIAKAKVVSPQEKIDDKA